MMSVTMMGRGAAACVVVSALPALAWGVPVVGEGLVARFALEGDATVIVDTTGLSAGAARWSIVIDVPVDAAAAATSLSDEGVLTARWLASSAALVIDDRLISATPETAFAVEFTDGVSGSLFGSDGFGVLVGDTAFGGTAGIGAFGLDGSSLALPTDAAIAGVFLPALEPGLLAFPFNLSGGDGDVIIGDFDLDGFTLAVVPAPGGAALLLPAAALAARRRR